MKQWMKALDSGWRAFWKQYRRTRTLQHKARTMADPMKEPAEAMEPQP